MDWTIIDVTDLPSAVEGCEVIVIGTSGERSITAANVARHTGSISYEVTCGISSRVPRKYVGGWNDDDL